MILLMNTKIVIKLKAALLLTVFSLNTVIGFACSAGVDMGFNSKHQHDEENMVADHSHNHDIHHHQDEACNAYHKSKNCKENCCNDEVIKFSQVDKAIPDSPGSGLIPSSFSAFISTFCAFDVLYTSKEIANNRHFLRSYHPPIPDIRIAIQSFQI